MQTIIALLVVASFAGCATSAKTTNSDAVPNAARYPEVSDPNSPIHKAVTLHRTVKSCADDAVTKPEEVIALQRPDGTRYENAICRSRKVEQCNGVDANGEYYDEWCEDATGSRIPLP